MRIFHDRLIDELDRNYLKQILEELFINFKFEKHQVIDVERIIFGDYWQGRDVDPRHYYQVTDL
jgi:dynein heavy chain, axonemal